MPSSHAIQLLITGGTLDKDYDALTGQLVFDETHLTQMLTQANLTVDVQTQVLMLKDSLEMQADDRDIVLQACLASPNPKILITHGTDTMALTAQHIAQNLPDNHQKTIVLTGAMRPYALGHSDALFNLGSAIMALNLTRPGVFIAMNGQLFDARNVTKNTQLGIFEYAEMSSNISSPSPNGSR